MAKYISISSKIETFQSKFLLMKFPHWSINVMNLILLSSVPRRTHDPKYLISQFLKTYGVYLIEGGGLAETRSVVNHKY